MFFAKLHPLLVHFPVALLVSGSFLEIYARVQKEPVAAQTGRFNVRFGFWMILATMAVGLLGLLEIEVQDKFRRFLTFHILLAFTTAGVYGAGLLLLRFGRQPWAGRIYLLLLGVGLVVTLATGYCGGELVHRFGLPAFHLAD